MTLEQASRLLTTEPATKDEKNEIIRMVGEITAANVPCPICNKTHGIDFDHPDTYINTDKKWIHAFCQHCGSITYIEMPNLFEAEDPEDVYGERNAISRKQWLRDYFNRQLAKMDLEPEYN